MAECFMPTIIGGAEKNWIYEPAVVVYTTYYQVTFPFSLIDVDAELGMGNAPVVLFTQREFHVARVSYDFSNGLTIKSCQISVGGYPNIHNSDTVTKSGDNVVLKIYPTSTYGGIHSVTWSRLYPQNGLPVD